MHDEYYDYYDFLDMDEREEAFSESTKSLPGLSDEDGCDDAERQAVRREFRGIVGYGNLKNELVQICDVMRNRAVYDRLDARIPRGLFLYGSPGVGKTTMAEAVAAASGRPVIRLRRNAAGDRFIEEIKDAFRRAKEQAPSVLLMDDMDKFADGSDSYGTAAEYAVIQAAVDELEDGDVFLIATANTMGAIPESLVRQGRFDRRRRVCYPGLSDAEQILKKNLSDNVKLSDDLDMRTLAVMTSGESCAFIETMANEAAIMAGFEGSEEITMTHFINAWRRCRGDLISRELSPEEKLRTAYYQAGKAVITALMAPQALTFTYAGLHCGADDAAYFGSMQLNGGDDKLRFSVMSALAGRAAEELHYGDFDDQCTQDIREAYETILDMISGGNGDYLEVVQAGPRDVSSEMTCERISDHADAEIEEYYRETLQLLRENADFLDRVAEAMMENEYLFAEDILKIQKETGCAA